MRLTVLHAIPSLVGGGAERQLSLLAPELCRLGVDTHVAYVHPGVNLAPLLASPVNLHPLACSGNHDPRILLKLLRLIRDCRPDVVQTWLPQMDILAGVAAKLTATPFVLSERSSAMAYGSGWKNRLRKLVGHRSTAVVANSQSGVDYWGRQNGTRRVIRNGLALQAIRSATPAQPETLGLPADARIVLFAGRLNAEKNVATLLQALEVVLERRPECAAVLFGQGPLHAPLRAQVEAMRGRKRVRLADFTPDLWRWMRRASAFVSVSHFEGNPNTVLEAMAIGCPLVVSAIAQHREILDDTMARFCNPASSDDIAGAIDGVLSAPEQATKRAAAAIEAANAWSVERAARDYLDLYQELSRNSASPQGDGSP
ncbi:MAG: glycosyltransferase [Burkholderiales bacterium]|nr:glycosyltransferase [Burkholderiales bacterium]